jgi:hypothetical protein
MKTGPFLLEKALEAVAKLHLTSNGRVATQSLIQHLS